MWSSSVVRTPGGNPDGIVFTMSDLDLLPHSRANDQDDAPQGSEDIREADAAQSGQTPSSAASEPSDTLLSEAKSSQLSVKNAHSPPQSQSSSKLHWNRKVGASI